MALNMKNISVVHWFPQPENHRCGYCKSDSGSISYGMWAEKMTVRDYQNLIDRGWRRSGRYCYKPIMNEICCPQYTIRCDTLNFKISKSQKKVIKKFNKYLCDGILSSETRTSESESGNHAEDSMFVLKERPNTNFDYNGISSTLTETSTDSLTLDHVASCSNVSSRENTACETINKDLLSERASKKVKCDNASPHSVRKGLGADPNKLPCKKAKLLRRERKQQKMMEKGITAVQSIVKNKVKSLEQFLYDIPENCKHLLKIKLVRMSNDEDPFSDFNTEYEVYKKYQMIIHNDPPEKCSKKSFARFLVNTPLKEEMWGNSDLGFGSFHQQYWIDDVLVAVGVIDILPKCVSSVYFFYDPNYRSLTLGTYGSLREVDFTRKLYQNNPSIRYYYMGFYIHSCPKMRYKGKLDPSDLLCPETYKWFPISECVPKLEQNKYCRFNDDPNDVDENCCSDKDIDQIKIFVVNGYVKFKNYKHRSSERRVYQNIGKLVGKKCVDSLLFIDQGH